MVYFKIESLKRYKVALVNRKDRAKSPASLQKLLHAIERMHDRWTQVYNI